MDGSVQLAGSTSNAVSSITSRDFGAIHSIRGKDLVSIYQRKCQTSKTHISKRVCARLSSIDEGSSNVFDLSLLPTSLPSFHNLMECLAIAHGVRSVSMRGCDAVDGDVELMTHHTAMNPSVVSVDISDNPRLTSSSATSIIDLLKLKRNLLEVSLRGCVGISVQLQESIQSLCERNKRQRAARGSVSMPLSLSPVLPPGAAAGSPLVLPRVPSAAALPSTIISVTRASPASSPSLQGSSGGGSDGKPAAPPGDGWLILADSSLVIRGDLLPLLSGGLLVVETALAQLSWEHPTSTASVLLLVSSLLFAPLSTTVAAVTLMSLFGKFTAPQHPTTDPTSSDVERTAVINALVSPFASVPKFLRMTDDASGTSVSDRQYVTDALWRIRKIRTNVICADADVRSKGVEESAALLRTLYSMFVAHGKVAASLVVCVYGVLSLIVSPAIVTFCLVVAAYSWNVVGGAAVRMYTRATSAALLASSDGNPPRTATLLPKAVRKETVPLISCRSSSRNNSTLSSPRVTSHHSQASGGTGLSLPTVFERQTRVGPNASYRFGLSDSAYDVSTKGPSSVQFSVTISGLQSAVPRWAQLLRSLDELLCLVITIEDVCWNLTFPAAKLFQSDAPESPWGEWRVASFRTLSSPILCASLPQLGLMTATGTLRRGVESRLLQSDPIAKGETSISVNEGWRLSEGSFTMSDAPRKMKSPQSSQIVLDDEISKLIHVASRTNGSPTARKSVEGSPSDCSQGNYLEEALHELTHADRESRRRHASFLNHRGFGDTDSNAKSTPLLRVVLTVEILSASAAGKGKMSIDRMESPPAVAFGAFLDTDGESEERSSRDVDGDVAVASENHPSPAFPVLFSGKMRV